MTTMHTPGPWEIAGDENTFVYALGPGGTNLFWLNVSAGGPEKISDDEKVANARLIAAAPDLLDALKIIVGQSSEGPGSTGIAGWFGAIARVAIAKATGA